jgi:hypothetical protein
MEIHGDGNSWGWKFMGMEMDGVEMDGVEMDGVEMDGVEMDGRRKKTKPPRISGWGGENADAKDMHFRRCAECPWAASGIFL